MVAVTCTFRLDPIQSGRGFIYDSGTACLLLAASTAGMTRHPAFALAFPETSRSWSQADLASDTGDMTRGVMGGTSVSFKH